MAASKPATPSQRKPRKKNVPRRRTKASASKPREKDPAGGLTAAGRAHFKQTEGAKLRPGVKKPIAEMTPSDMRRKGSFLRRQFAHLRGPLSDESGKPTRLALSANAWGEAIPKTIAAAKRLANKGLRLLTRYKRAKTSAKDNGK